MSSAFSELSGPYIVKKTGHLIKRINSQKHSKCVDVFPQVQYKTTNSGQLLVGYYFHKFLFVYSYGITNRYNTGSLM
jgi:hypothetical protein